MSISASLQESLETVIESCVNKVGVDLNTSSWTLLRFVAGITERTALNIVSYRNEKGSFRSRTQVLEVPGIGPKTFEQAAGFLRIRNGDNPLDMTAVHPESYPVVEQIAARSKPLWKQIIQQAAVAGESGSQPTLGRRFYGQRYSGRAAQAGPRSARQICSAAASAKKCARSPMCRRAWCWKAW